jgi:hypothetical protein
VVGKRQILLEITRNSLDVAFNSIENINKQWSTPHLRLNSQIKPTVRLRAIPARESRCFAYTDRHRRFVSSVWIFFLPGVSVIYSNRLLQVGYVLVVGTAAVVMALPSKSGAQFGLRVRSTGPAGNFPALTRQNVIGGGSLSSTTATSGTSGASGGSFSGGTTTSGGSFSGSTTSGGSISGGSFGGSSISGGGSFGGSSISGGSFGGSSISGGSFGGGSFGGGSFSGGGSFGGGGLGGGGGKVGFNGGTGL